MGRGPGRPDPPCVAYDEALAQRLRARMSSVEGASEKKMFGGLCFLLNGHMVCGIVGDELMMRVGADAHDAALARPHARPMDFTGRPMRGMVYVAPDGFRENAALDGWLEAGLEHARGLPPKTARPARARGASAGPRRKTRR